jgi:plastocyanin
MSTPSTSLKLILAAGLVAAAVVIAIALLLGQHRPKPPASVNRSVNVSITKDGFVPATLTIPVGTQVTWVDDDDINPSHWVEADPYPTPAHPSDLSSGRLMDEMRYSYKFATTGVYHYHDRDYPTHSATITVK